MPQEGTFVLPCKNCLYPPGPTVWTKEGEQTVFSQMAGEYLVWTNLNADQPQCNNPDFNISKYSLLDYKERFLM